MKYTITVNQQAADDVGLRGKIDIVDLAIISYVNDWYANPGAVMNDGHVWINYRHLMEELPYLGIKAKGAISLRVERLIKHGVFTRRYDSDKRLYLKPTELMGRLFFKKQGVHEIEQGTGDESVHGDEQTVHDGEHSTIDQLTTNQVKDPYELLSPPVESLPEDLPQYAKTRNGFAFKIKTEAPSLPQDEESQDGAIEKPPDKIKRSKGERSVINKLLMIFGKAYKAEFTQDYVIISWGREAKAMQQLLRAYQAESPDAGLEQTLHDFELFFTAAVQVKDRWLHDRISPSMIVSKFNDIKRMINGNGREPKLDAQFFSDLYKKHFGVK